MDDPDTVLVAGYKLDRYELLCPIASGGMATVWLARMRGKRGFEKLFAVKMIKTEHLADARFQEMFMDEARIASAIEHPNVAQILDLGEQDGLLYTVMEWVDGESLAKLARLAQKRGTPIPVGISLRIIADTCAGLHAAHELRDADDHHLGVVHRDVSPQNILVTTGGAVKVIDFGVAKAVNRRVGDTQSGVVKGKIRYMAPEQVGGRGATVNHRVDLWAAGVCLYELVTGKPPYDEISDVDVIRRLMEAEPAPNLAGTPAELAPIFASTLARDPDARFATAAALRRAIEATIDEMGHSVTSDDVAEFIRDKLSDLAKKRRATVTRAIEDAKTRATASATASGGVPPAPTSSSRMLAADDVAFAPTIASAPRAKAAEARSVTSRDESGPKTTAGATLSDQVGERRTSVFPWLFAIVVVAGVGTSAWYANARWRRDAPQPPVAAASSSPMPSASPSAAPTVSAPLEPAAAEAIDASVEPAPSSASAGGPHIRMVGPHRTPIVTHGVDAGTPVKPGASASVESEPEPAPTVPELTQ